MNAITIPTVGEPPIYAHPDDAGADITLPIDLTLLPGVITSIDLPLKISIPPGHFGLLALRSSLGRRGVMLINGVGIIDAGYSGYIGLTLTAIDDTPVTLVAGERIAQIVLIPVTHGKFVQSPLTETARGAGGFGSTGTH